MGEDENMVSFGLSLRVGIIRPSDLGSANWFLWILPMRHIDKEDAIHGVLWGFEGCIRRRDCALVRAEGPDEGPSMVGWIEMMIKLTSGNVEKDVAVILPEAMVLGVRLAESTFEFSGRGSWFCLAIRRLRVSAFS